jgi:hypothetical protein
MTIGEILSRPVEQWLTEDLVTLLSDEGQWMLASTIALLMTKPG